MSIQEEAGTLNTKLLAIGLHWKSHMRDSAIARAIMKKHRATISRLIVLKWYGTRSYEISSRRCDVY